MNKFVIEKAIIEKTEKDINIDNDLEFTSGLNLICGKNEVGKSSLMNFLKTTLLLKSNNDIGKVLVSISNNQYLIQTKQKSKERTIFSLSNNKKIDIDFIKENIPEKAFEYVFSMNLDDLMANTKEASAQKLIELMKDSSCEYLNNYLTKKKAKIDKILGSKGVKDDLAKLKNNIISLDKEIKEYSNNEKNYNNVINELNIINEELRELSSKENLIEINEKIYKLDEKIKELENEYKLLSINFNSNLIKNNSEYLKLNEKALNHKNNLEKIKENESKLDDLNTKIMFTINKLKKEFFVNFSIEELTIFNLDYERKKQITDSLEKQKLINNELTICLNDKKNLKEQISIIDNKIEILNSKYKFSNSIEELENLHKYIDDSLKYYNHLQNKINEFENQIITNQKEFISNKTLLIISCLISILSFAFSIYGFYQKMYLLGSFSIAILLLSSFILHTVKVENNNKDLPELENYKSLKNKIIKDLIEKLKNICPEIIEMNHSLMMLKINDIKQEIFSKKEQLEEKSQDKNGKRQKLNDIEININNLETTINEINSKNKELIKIDFEETKLSANEYLQVIDLVENVKDVIKEKLNLEKTNNNLNILNNEIENEFKNFISINKIDLPFEDKFSKKIEQLKTYYVENSNLNRKIEVLKVKLDSYKEEKAELESFKEKNKFCNEQISLIELEHEIKNKNKQKDELLGQKNALEHIEGLEKLKIKRNILQEKYNTELTNLLKDKIIIALCEKAKSNFDKKQPNLQKAQEFLSILTNGKYTKINLDNELIQNDSGTITKEWKNLSRGTKELLYFALKLGFAFNYSKDKITLESNDKLNLPLIIDDALVNFDTERTKNAIKCLIEFSKTNQVLFFTCHSEVMKKYFKELCEDLNIVNL